MLNDRDEKYEGSEESEYHFSDEEVNYEIDSEPSKETPAAAASGKGGNWLGSIAQSKRMMISLGVFLALIYVVYKMVAPTTSVPPTDITPQTSPVATQQMTRTVQVQPAAVIAVAPPAAVPVAATPTQPLAESVQPAVTMPAAQPTIAQQPAIMPAAPVAAAPEMATQQASMTPPPAMNVPVSGTVQPATTADMTQQLMAPVQQAMANMQQTVSSMPSMIPVSTMPQQAAALGQPVVMSMPPSMPVSMPVTSTDPRVVQVTAENQRLMNQLQAEYAQRIADYQAQNKNLQDQVQTLNSRVAGMETEMTQLIQTLTKQFQGGGGGADNTTTVAPAQPQADVRVPYSVQAIIPGRAWLRSDSGDTITVAEGDTVKDLGRVTKIDPYDGVVEINVGNKTVSLSYGNGG